MSDPSSDPKGSTTSDLLRPAAASDALRSPPAANRHDRPAPQHPLSAMHQAFGNLGVLQRLPAPAVQPKLEIGAPDDEHEREADAVAAAVIRRPEEEDPALSQSAATIRRAPEEKKKPAEAPKAAPKTAPKPKPKPKPAAKPKPKPKLPVDQAAAEKKSEKDKRKPPEDKQAAVKAPPKPKPGEPKTKPAAAKPGAAKPQPAVPEPAEKPPPGSQERKPDEPIVAAKAMPGAVPAVTPAAAQTIQSSQGGGRPLAPADRGFYESRLGRDLGGVRVHDDPSAGRAARDIQAQAFTYGQDVFFAPGRYQPGTSAGRELLAHELAHTIQQRPGAKLERRIQRAPNTPEPTKAAPDLAEPRNDKEKVLTFKTLKVPKFRMVYSPDKYAGQLTRPANYSRTGKKDQRQVWTDGTRGGVAGKLPDFLGTTLNATPVGGKYYLKSSGGTGSALPPRYYIGNVDELAGQLTRPEWDSKGAGHGFRGFQVDHILELQLSGGEGLDNLQLLDASVNASSGKLIQTNIEKTMSSYLASLDESERTDPALALGNWQEKWTLRFNAALGEGGKDCRKEDIWRDDKISAGAHLLKPPLMQAAGKDLGSADALTIIPSGGGIATTTLNPNDDPGKITFFKPFRVTGATYNIAEGDDEKPALPLAEFSFTLESPAFGGEAPPKVGARRLPGARFAGTVDRSAAKSMLAGLNVTRLSPIEIDTVEFGPNGIYAEARVTSTLKIFEGASIDLVLDGDKLTISKTFTVGDFKLPPPMKVTQAQLTLSGSSTGELSAVGQIDAEVEKVGKGYLKAGGSTKGGLSFEGKFTFTSELFEKAEATFAYADGHYSGKGDLEIGKGKVAGVKSGKLTAAFGDEQFTASGHADFEIPGVESADVALSYDAKAGLSITAAAKLKEMPGISSGSLSITVAQPPDGGGFKLKGTGTAKPAIPGIDAELTVSYDDGAFLAKVSVPFERGLIKGKLEAGATNRALDEKDQPTGAVQDAVRIFGSGSATVQITPWLTGTAGIRLLANGEVEVHGELSVPGVNLYEGKDYSKPLFDSPPIEFPIFGPVVLAISGGVRLRAGIGPGVLKGSLGIDYNPSHEDNTHLHGSLHLHASAFAGIELYTRVGVGLSAVIGSITGNIELGAELKIEASVDPDVKIDWTPKKGLSLDVEIAAKLQPKLVFRLSAVIVARAGPFSTDWKKELGKREFGSGLDLGMTLPIHYEEGKKFDLDFSAVKFQTPDIDAVQTAKNFLKEVAK